MKKRGSKLRKILLRTLLILVFFSSVVAVLTRNKYVQTRIAQYLTSYISSELKAKVSIKAVEIDFLSNFQLEDFLIEDRHGETVFFASTFNFRIAHFSYRKQKIKIHAIELNKLVIHIGDYAGEKGMNFDFISDYFASPTPAKESKPWFFEGRDIKIRNAEFLQFYYKNVQSRTSPMCITMIIYSFGILILIFHDGPWMIFMEIDSKLKNLKQKSVVD